MASTQAFYAELSADMGIPISEMEENNMGVVGAMQEKLMNEVENWNEQFNILGKVYFRWKGKILIRVYYRPVFFKNLKVNWNKKFLYSLEINGLCAECVSLDDVLSLIGKEISF